MGSPSWSGSSSPDGALRFRAASGGDLIAIRDFIANDNATAALNLMRDFRAAFRLLAQRPALGHPRRDLTTEPLLFWPLRGYMIIYQLRLADIEIVAVMHGARDIPTVLRRRSG